MASSEDRLIKYFRLALVYKKTDTTGLYLEVCRLLGIKLEAFLIPQFGQVAVFVAGKISDCEED